MKILVLTGPAGAGKNTVAQILAKKRDRCAVIDVDAVRWMLLQPHKAPWSGEEGRQQQILGVKNACTLANNFVQNNSDVVILDVLSEETLKIYKKVLGKLNPKIILLLPIFEEIQRRNKTRPLHITEEEIAVLYKSQEILHNYDEKIDNSNLSAEEVADKLNAVLNHERN